jgi:selenocysteine-specific elongation factor
LDLHGVLGREVAPDLVAAAEDAALSAVSPQASLSAARTAGATALRRGATVRRDAALRIADDVVDRLIETGRLVRDDDTLRLPGTASTTEDPAEDAAMDRLEALLAVAAPPALSVAARSAACPPEAVRRLERDGRIVVLEPDLAYAAATYRELTARALDLADREPLTPARLRDETGTSRKYVMAILEDLDRRAILRRTPAGHVPGPKAPAASSR